MTRASGTRRRGMFLRAAMMLTAAVFTLAACDDDSGGTSTTPCNLDTGASSISGNLTVHYEASTSGNGTLSSITYTTDAGDVVVPTPTLPWEVDVTLVTAHARVRAVGGVSNGSIEIQYQADGGPGNVEQGENTCSAD